MVRNIPQFAPLVQKQTEKRLTKKQLRAQLRRALVQEQHCATRTAKVLCMLPNRPGLKESIIDCGNVLLADALTGDFIASIYTLHGNDETGKHLRAKFDWAVQILYHHGLARKKWV